MINLKTGEHFRDAAKTMTRGGFLRGILASGIAPSLSLGALGLSGSANATVGRGMMRGVGARNAVMFGGKTKWVNPYDTEDHALIAHWDADWNKAGEVHDNTMLGMNDLSGKAGFATYCRSLRYTSTYLTDVAPIWGSKSIDLSTDANNYRKGFRFDTTSEMRSFREGDFTAELISSFMMGESGACFGISLGSFYNSPATFRRDGIYAYIATPSGQKGGYHLYLANSFHLFIRKGNGLLNFSCIPRRYFNPSFSVDSSFGYVDNNGSIGLFVEPSNSGCYGSFYSCRIYNRYLTDAELSARHSLDVRRFGIS